MLQWLKRLPERVLFAVLVAVAYLSIAAALLLVHYALLRFGVPHWLAFLAAIGVFPVTYVAWKVVKGLVWILTRFAAWLWKFRACRRTTYVGLVAAAALVAGWNLHAAGDNAWLGLGCEAIGVFAILVAALLANPPERWLVRLRRFRVSAGYAGLFNAIRVAAWLLAILLIDVWLRATVRGLIGDNWIAIPLSWLERIRIPLALLPPLVFTIAALLARPPYLRRAAPRWVYVVKRTRVPVRERFHHIFGRIPLYRLDLMPKMVEFTAPDGRVGHAGERFVFARMIWTGLALTTFASMIGLAFAADWFLPSVPKDLSSVEQYQPPVATVVYDRNGAEMCRFTVENRTYVDLSQIPVEVQEAFIAAEDQHFWEHDGIDPNGIVRAGVANFQSGETRQGASTITQQVIKQVVLKDSSKSMKRKLTELVLAPRFETQMTDMLGSRHAAKEKILEIYLNHVYLGDGNYGVEAAALGYFGKHAKDLTRAEAAMLAAMPKAPALDAPDKHFARAKERQRYVLDREVELGMLTSSERDAAWKEPIVTIRRTHSSNVANAPYACEEVRKFAERQFGYEAVYKQGLVIRTTFDLPLLRKAQASIRYGLLDLERRLGFAGPEGHDKNASDRCEEPEWVDDEAIEANARVIARDRSSIALCVRGNRVRLDPDDVARVQQWERAKPGRVLRLGDLMTVRLETRDLGKGKTERVALTARRTGGKGHPEALQAALVAIDPNDGEIRAIVGGYDWNESQYDAATQAHRQTGSSIKPYVYLTALMNGETVVSTVEDAPICVPTASGEWCPRNYDGPHVTQVYYGLVDLMTALAKSLNSVSVRLTLEVGLDKVLGTIRALGVRSPIERVYPVAVGTPELTLREHAAGYATLLSEGREMAVQHDGDPPGIFVKSVSAWVRGLDGRVQFKTLYEAPKRPDAQAVPSGDAYAMIHLMRGVVQFGTGTRAKKLRRPIAGKTGTTNSFHDVWFMGGSADLTVGVWVGRMTPTPIAKEATGGGVALPIWEAFMELAFPVPKKEGDPFETPPRDFPIPNDVTLILNGETEDGRPSLLPFQRGKMPDAYLKASSGFGHDAFE